MRHLYISRDKIIIHKMNTNSREADHQLPEAKQEQNTSNIFKITGSSSRPNPWSRHKDNPRIVRVAKDFEGKDRHSKVCTVRGLRDRRIRLSTPTAVQIYDLQEKLGLNQPSKVIDWLLDITKHDIDQLPPLQLPHPDISSNILSARANQQDSVMQWDPSTLSLSNSRSNEEPQNYGMFTMPSTQNYIHQGYYDGQNQVDFEMLGTSSNSPVNPNFFYFPLQSDPSKKT